MRAFISLKIIVFVKIPAASLSGISVLSFCQFNLLSKIKAIAEAMAYIIS
jgi:hypothetical protein